jgi:CHAT domain-containing protein
VAIPSALLALEGAPMKAPYHPCPDDDVLQEVAAGLSSPELAERTWLHASRCSTCGPALKRYVREFSDETTPENAHVLEQLESSKPQWQRRLVREVVGRKGFRWPRLIPAFAALAAVLLAVLAGPHFLREYRIHQAQKEVAAAFAERRTSETRLTSTEYSAHRPFPTELGGESGRSVDELPPSLHNALSAAIENLKKPHADPHWLQIQGRALLWEATPSSLEKAEKNFEKARAEGLNSPDLEIDLAAAYYERDNKSDHPNLQRTLDLLNKVLTEPKLTDKQRASALFNLAIAYEKIQVWDLAVSAWDKYLKVDSSSPWATEARRHLQEIKARLPATSSKNYDSPASFLDSAARQDFQPEDLEQYQQKALGRWLPVAFRDRKSDFHRALVSLAHELAEGHSDPWLQDFLAELDSKKDSGAEALSAAVLDNEKGLYVPAIDKAKAAANLFTAQKNEPGRLFARFQEVYGKRSLLQAEACLQDADRLWNELSRTNYRWLRAEVALERAQCRNFRGDLADSDSDSKVSLSVAARSHFPVLELRVLGISAAMQSQQGRCDSAWEQGIQGLKRYWQGAYPRDRLDQFYSVMWQCSEESGALNAAEALLQHTLDMRQAAAARNAFREAMLHLRLRNMFLAQHRDALAAEEDAKASALLKSLENKNIDATEYRLVNDIEPAELQLQQGDPTRALATVNRVGNTLKTLQSGLILLNFNRVLGSIYLQLKRFDDATAAFQTAINIAETAMESLKDRGERLKWLRATDDCYRGLVRVLLEEQKPAEALERWEWYQSRPLLQGFHSGSRSPRVTRPDNKKRTLASVSLGPIGATHLIYANFKDGLQIWVASSRGVQGTWVKVRQQDFERAVRDFAERCSTPDSILREVQEVGSWLYSQLLQPVISQLPESEAITIELDRSAYNLSVEALPSPAGWYFGEKYQIVYSPGWELEQAVRAPRAVDSRSEILVLDASRSPGAGFLPGMEAQRSTIAGIFSRVRVVDSTATSWSEVGPQLKSSQVFHYMGHGRPDGSGTTLVFNAKESLRAKDIAPEWFAHSQLVVLAACSTALGRENGLLDTNSLVRGFLVARVPRIIASHWDVDSATTSKLMISFYQNIAKHKSVVQAIFDARKELLLSHPHPYYWASFSLTGRVS